MIFVRDKGQMCNNILQYAHLYAWGRAHGRSTLSMRFAYKYQYFKICNTRWHNFAMYLMGKWGAGLGLLPVVDFDCDDCSMEQNEKRMLSKRNVVVQGWNVRFYDHFLRYKQEIVDLFAIHPSITAPVKARLEADAPRGEVLRLGVHIRRGDYARWMGGRYFFSDEVYVAHIDAFAQAHPGKTIAVFLSTNDPAVDPSKWQSMLQNGENVTVYRYNGGPADDLCMLSECDYVIGPPSTFSLVAVMYRDIPLSRMLTPTPTLDFKDFNTLFRQII